jgi:hypothetical protein
MDPARETILGLKSEASTLSQQAHGVIPSEAEESPLAGGAGPSG